MTMLAKCADDNAKMDHGSNNTNTTTTHANHGRANAMNQAWLAGSMVLLELWCCESTFANSFRQADSPWCDNKGPLRIWVVPHPW